MAVKMFLAYELLKDFIPGSCPSQECTRELLAFHVCQVHGFTQLIVDVVCGTNYLVLKTCTSGAQAQELIMQPANIK
eukprot:2614450-Amphidinium_carterae.1